MTDIKQTRVITYIDGFNLYHGIRQQKYRRYLWLDLQKLSASLLKPNQRLITVNYFTARMAAPADKVKRQNTFLEATQTLPLVKQHFGFYQPKPQACGSCRFSWKSAEEKQTDVKLATAMVADAFLNLFDLAMLISGDSDHVPCVESVMRHFPQKRVIVAFPPDRVSRQLEKAASDSFVIGRAKLAHSQLPYSITLPNGHTLTRPETWV